MIIYKLNQQIMMITYQRLLLKTFNSILGLPSQRLTNLTSFSFGS